METAIISVASLVVGWALNEISTHLRRTGEYKCAISTIISLLLEIRYQAIYMELVVTKLKQLGAPPEAIVEFRSGLEKMLPAPTNIKETYDSAVDIVSKKDPLLGFKFRNRNSSIEYMNRWRDMAINTGGDVGFVESLEVDLQNKTIPILNEIICELSRQHSRSTHKKIKDSLDETPELPIDVDDLLNKCVAKS